MAVVHQLAKEHRHETSTVDGLPLITDNSVWMILSARQTILDLSPSRADRAVLSVRHIRGPPQYGLTARLCAATGRKHVPFDAVKKPGHPTPLRTMKSVSLKVSVSNQSRKDRAEAFARIRPAPGKTVA